MITQIKEMIAQMEKKTIAFLLFSVLLIVLIPPVFLNADEDVPVDMFGLIGGGTGLLGLTYEGKIGLNSAGMNVGVYDIDELAIAFFAKRYFEVPEIEKFGLMSYAGFGIWSVSLFPQGGFSTIVLVHMPFGIDWKFFEIFHAGLEVGVNYSVYERRFNTEWRTSLGVANKFAFLPGAYIKIGF